jgi:hypothetical protein
MHGLKNCHVNSTYLVSGVGSRFSKFRRVGSAKSDPRSTLRERFRRRRGENDALHACCRINSLAEFRGVARASSMYRDRACVQLKIAGFSGRGTGGHPFIRGQSLYRKSVFSTMASRATQINLQERCRGKQTRLLEFHALNARSGATKGGLEGA